VPVATEDDFCIRCNGALQETVVGRVGVHDVDALGGRNAAGNDVELFVGLSEFGRAMELVSRDAESFCPCRIAIGGHEHRRRG
jgi:hypothetical protein